MTITATVSGSFHDGMPEVQRAVAELSDLGVSVLSPSDPRVVDRFGDFLFVASDRLRSIRLVQQRHLAAIAASNFLWLVAPAGYVGTSAAMEIGYAVALTIPVYTDTAPNDLTLRQYVRVLPSLRTATTAVADCPQAPTPDVLIDPGDAVSRAHQHLEVIERRLIRPATPVDETDAVASAAAADVRSILQRL
jgi:hypothetical protein